jgi:hypothetical protein
MLILLQLTSDHMLIFIVSDILSKEEFITLQQNEEQVDQNDEENHAPELYDPIATSGNDFYKSIIDTFKLNIILLQN